MVICKKYFTLGKVIITCNKQPGVTFNFDHCFEFLKISTQKSINLLFINMAGKKVDWFSKIPMT